MIRSCFVLIAFSAFALALVVPAGCGGSGGVIESAVGCNLPSGSGSGVAPSPAEQAWALEMLGILNGERSAFGLAPLAWSDEAAAAAYGHSVDMDHRDFFDHENPDGVGFAGRLSAQGVAWIAVGENLSMGPGRCTPAEAMSRLMDSPTHRANILDEIYTHVGVGVHAASGGPWWTQVFFTPLAPSAR
ncbi:MAG: CAP domain-containing protein [Planctomycetota bacterium]